MAEQAKRWLGIDFGLSRIGVAISDPLGILASGLETVTWNGKDLDRPALRIAQLVQDHDVAGIILGYPARTDGRQVQMAGLIDDFASRIKAGTGVKIHLHDERFTTVLARQKLREAGIREKRQRPVIDQVAAEIILQEFLDNYRKPCL